MTHYNKEIEKVLLAEVFKSFFRTGFSTIHKRGGYIIELCGS
jgi:hypothetical protein